MKEKFTTNILDSIIFTTSRTQLPDKSTTNFREPNLATSSFIGRNSAQFLYHFEIFGCSFHVCSRMKLSSEGVECISRVCESRELDKSAQQFQKAASKNQLAPKKIGLSRSSLDCTWNFYSTLYVQNDAWVSITVLSNNSSPHISSHSKNF